MQQKLGLSLPGNITIHPGLIAFFCTPGNSGLSALYHVKGILGLIIQQSPTWISKCLLSPFVALLLLDRIFHSHFPFLSLTYGLPIILFGPKHYRRLQSVTSNWTPALVKGTPSASSNTILLGAPFKYERSTPLGEASSTKILRNEGEQIRSPIIHSPTSVRSVLP